MFVGNHLGCTHIGYPDACNTPTPAGPVPIPYPNVAVSTTSQPLVPEVFIGCAPVQMLLDTNPVSNGDQAGTALGVASGMIAGPQRNVTGSISTYAGSAPVVLLGSVGTQNGMNTFGVEAAPGQFRVLALK